MPLNEIVEANVIRLSTGLESGRLFCRSFTRPAGAFPEAAAMRASPRAAGVQKIRTAGKNYWKPRAAGGLDPIGRILNREDLIPGNSQLQEVSRSLLIDLRVRLFGGHIFAT